MARIGGSLLAFRDSCPACGEKVSAGTLLGEVLSCPGCGAGFDLPKAGRPVNGDAWQLEPVPLLSEEAGVRVALAS